MGATPSPPFAASRRRARVARPSASVLIASGALLALAAPRPTGLTAQSLRVIAGDSARVAIPFGGVVGIPLRVDLASAGSTLNLAYLTGELRWRAARLRHDSTTLTVAGAFWGPYQGPDRRAIGYGSMNPGVELVRVAASGPLATVWFTAAAAGAGGTRVRYVATAANAEDRSNVLPAVMLQSVDVCVAPGPRWGDVNADSAVNIVDAQQIARASVGLSVANAAALAARGDVSNDGTVNIQDAQQIARHSVRLSAAARINLLQPEVPAVASLTVTPAAASLAAGGAVALAAEPSSAAGELLAGCAAVTYASSAPAVATVSADGVVTAMAAGSATITATADGRSAAAVITVTPALGTGFGSEQFARIEPGSFVMGSGGSGRPDERPVRTVSLTRAFLLQRTEVTRGQWLAVMGSLPSEEYPCGASCPVTSVSAAQIQAFLAALALQDPGKGYRLPTEAEWEYAARAGTTGDYGGTGAADDMGWFLENAMARPWPVARKVANAWGLFDLHGNAYELVQDWYASTYTGAGTTDPTGPGTGDFRVWRGGDYGGTTEQVRSAMRVPGAADFRGGFRLARNP